MADDLLHAKTSVLWAKSKFISFHDRLNGWQKDNIKFERQATGSVNDVILAIETVPLPLEFSVEAGAYINVIRSALDILACALFKRNPSNRNIEFKTFFPIVESETNLQKNNPKKFLESIDTDSKRIILSLRPYKGGNDILWLLQKLDNIRKHNMLLTVTTQPAALSTGYISVGNGNVITLIGKNSPMPSIRYDSLVVINAPEYKTTEHAIAVLHKFADGVSAIIERFE